MGKRKEKKKLGHLHIDEEQTRRDCEIVLISRRTEGNSAGKHAHMISSAARLLLLSSSPHHAEGLAFFYEPILKHIFHHIETLTSPACFEIM